MVIAGHRPAPALLMVRQVLQPETRNARFDKAALKARLTREGCQLLYVNTCLVARLHAREK